MRRTNTRLLLLRLRLMQLSGHGEAAALAKEELKLAYAELTGANQPYVDVIPRRASR